VEPRELLYRLNKMHELTKKEKSAIELEDFQTLQSILLEKERLIQAVSFSPQNPPSVPPFQRGWAPSGHGISVDEISGLIERIIQGGKENERMVYQKWLDDKNELKKISDVRKTLIAYPKPELAPRIVDTKC